MSRLIDLLPDSFLQSMNELLGEETEKYLTSLNQPFYQGIRVNTSKISPEEFVKISPFSLKPIPWTRNGFYVDRSEDISKHPYYYAGLYYIQEPSAMVPASRLPIQKQDKVLDLCAAPGGKSTELSSRLEGTGCLVSNDISNSRAKALLKNLELFGAGNIYVCSESPEKMVKYYPEYFDKILIDAPCSGEGMFRKDASMLKSYTEHGPAYYADIQRSLLEQAYQMLKPGGYILYSTCTFAVLENEANIRSFLLKHTDMSMAHMEEYKDFSHGICQTEQDEKLQLEQCIRLFPHKLQGEGHFAALMKKHSMIDTNAPVKKSMSAPVKKKSNAAWDLFVRDSLCSPLQEGTLKQIGDSLYLLTEESAFQSKIRYLRTGLYLGECKKDRFEPSQALAMHVKKEMVQKVLDLPLSDERVLRYLKGETLTLQEEEDGKGWMLVCVDGYPLGWGKAVNGMLRNKYYSGWRMN